MEIKRIGIIHLNQIGDLVFSLTLLRALKEKYPGATIHSILRPHLKELLIQSPFVDKVIDRNKGIKNTLGLLKKIRRGDYDLLISLSNSSECMFLATFSGAKVKAGFKHFPWDLVLDAKDKIEGHHSWYNNFKLLKKMGIDAQKKDYVGLLVLPPEGIDPSLFQPQGKYVVISPGASARRRIKAWEERKFANLILLLKRTYGFNPVLVGGRDDVEQVARIIDAVREKDDGVQVGPVVNLAGKVGLKDLCYVLEDASLFVGVDSGVMHLASSLDVPVVGVFGPSDPFYVGPQNERSAVVREEMECIPCYLKGCADRTCMKRLDVEKVFDACQRVLNPQS